MNMDLLTNYSGFKEDIETAFKDLINEFDLTLTEPYVGSFLLKGPKCDITLYYDRGVISCAFKQITDKELDPAYEVWPVYRYLYHIEQLGKRDDSADWGSPKQQLVESSNIIQTKLKNILIGDFSWLDGYLKKEKREGQLTLFVFDLDQNHPFKIKFWKGDPSWRADVEKYLLDNNIVLLDTKWGV
ncbi:MAG: hypothetical protein JWP44_2319 [Mucilaginibacter sp.]|nr:hypothetical protein [Mucilaginibacter sp.]